MHQHGIIQTNNNGHIAISVGSKNLVDEYITKHGDTFEERQNNEPIVNKIMQQIFPALG